MKSYDYVTLAIIGILTLIFSACGTAPDEIQKTLQINKVAKVKYEEVADKIRFNDTFSTDKAASNIVSNEIVTFEFQLPEGWAELPKSQFKDINIAISEEPKALCYLTLLPLKGGEILPNLNRWRGQFSLPPIDDTNKQESETINFLDKETKLFKIVGDYKPLDENGKNFISLSLLQSDENNAYTFKFLGPADFIIKEKSKLIKFLMTLKVSKKNAEKNTETTIKLPVIPDQLQWEIPSGWVLAEAKPQRIATFKPKDKDGPECYIAAFGGGVLDNINRWRTQMKLAPVENMEKQELENFVSPIGSGVVVFLEGTYSGGMSGKPIESALMAGAIILGSNKTVFVKMVGTKEEVSKEKEAFLRLIKSLKGRDDAK